MAQTFTLKKISQQLNLSISTVSRALKNHPDISEKTRRKVKELAALMEYEPNAFAVNLRTSKSGVLGLIVPDISNTFNDSFIAAAENYARQSGYSLMILQSGEDPLKEAENLKLCKHYRVDGILISIVSESCSADLFAKYTEAGIPIVFFDRVPSSGNYDTVCMADEEAAVLAASTLIKYKKKNILGLFGNPKLSITKKRKEAFTQVLDKESNNIQYEPRYCINTEEAKQAVSEVLSRTIIPDHIFCMSDELLIGAMKAVKKTRFSIPVDITVLAISNGFIPGLFNPDITYIETNGYELGKLAIGRMLENLKEKTAPRSILLPSRFVEGGSL
jgi:LacI family transcriptional regulator